MIQLYNRVDQSNSASASTFAPALCAFYCRLQLCVASALAPPANVFHMDRYDRIITHSKLDTTIVRCKIVFHATTIPSRSLPVVFQTLPNVCIHNLTRQHCAPLVSLDATTIINSTTSLSIAFHGYDIISFPPLIFPVPFPSLPVILLVRIHTDNSPDFSKSISISFPKACVMPRKLPLFAPNQSQSSF